MVKYHQMNIRPIVSTCEQAQAVHFRLEIEAQEIEDIQRDVYFDDPNEVATALKGRERVLFLGERFLQTTLESCEACIADLVPEDLDECPNRSIFGFIIDTLTK